MTAKTGMMTSQTRVLRRMLAVLAVMAVLLTSQMGALASEAAPPDAEQATAVVVVPSGPGETTAAQDFTAGEQDNDATAAKPGVSVWGKCQVPGKCEIGISIKIRF